MKSTGAGPERFLGPDQPAQHIFESGQRRNVALGDGGIPAAGLGNHLERGGIFGNGEASGSGRVVRADEGFQPADEIAVGAGTIRRGHPCHEALEFGLQAPRRFAPRQPGWHATVFVFGGRACQFGQSIQRLGPLRLPADHATPAGDRVQVIRIARLDARTRAIVCAASTNRSRANARPRPRRGGGGSTRRPSWEGPSAAGRAARQPPGFRAAAGRPPGGSAGRTRRRSAG